MTVGGGFHRDPFTGQTSADNQDLGDMRILPLHQAPPAEIKSRKTNKVNTPKVEKAMAV